MPSFSERSTRELETCHPDLQILFQTVIRTYDCTIIKGHREQTEQDEAFRSGRSKLRFPLSKHNKMPSLAVDVSPYPIDWHDTKRFYHFAGYVLGTAESLGIKIRWGGDWNCNNDLSDQTFFDLPHFELVI